MTGTAADGAGAGAALPGRFVVAVDFSDRSWSVLPIVNDLAERLHAAVDFVHVEDSPPAIEDGNTRVRFAVAPDGQHADVDIIEGSDVPDSLDRYRQRVPRPMIALATHGRTGIRELAWGSTCERLITDYDDPVLTVGPEFDAARHSVARRVVVCQDPARTSPRAVFDGLAWATALGVPLVLLGVAGVTAKHPDEQQTAQRLAALSDSLPPTSVPVSVEVLRDRHAAAAVLRYTQARRGCLLVMTPHPWTEAVPFTTSSTRHVARHARCGLVLRRSTAHVPLPAPRADADSAVGRPVEVTDIHGEYPELTS